MPKANRTCKVCGVSYYYCAHCDEAKSGKQGYEPWHILVHDENCRKIFTILQEHFLKKITDREAVALLNGCDLTVINDDTIKAQVDAILATKKVRTRKAKTETIIKAEESEAEASVDDEAPTDAPDSDNS